MKTNIESEKLIERKLVKLTAEAGGWCLKLLALHCAGLPDRICLMPGGKVFFVETKSTGDKPRKIQLLVHKKLRALGFKVYVIDKSEQIYKLFI